MVQPYISFVTGSRNDEYAENMLFRMEVGLHTLIDQLARYSIESEIVVVDWNPPADRPPLMEALRVRGCTTTVTIKFIFVDQKHHRRYKYSDIRPYHNAAAYNVGIRRARGAFVLPRPADAIYSEPVMQFLATKSLSPCRVYRCDRCDMDPRALTNLDKGVIPLVESCSRHVFLRYAKISQDPLLAGLPDLHTHACGDFVLIARQYWHLIRGFYETADVACLDTDSLALHAVCGAGAIEYLLSPDCVVYKPYHSANWYGRTHLRDESFLRKLKRILQSMGIGLRMQTAIQARFNVPKRRLRSMPGAKFDSFARNFLVHAIRWAKGNGPYYLNDANWGLGDVQLPEITSVRAEWDQ